jgi:hypothetical protein
MPDRSRHFRDCLKAADGSRSLSVTVSLTSCVASPTHPFSASQNLLPLPGPQSIRISSPCVSSDAYDWDLEEIAA